MDMALQAYQLAADSPKKSDGQKTCCVSSEKDFGEYLKDTLEIIKIHLINNKSQKNDILLMQLLNLLNMNISVIDFETIIGHQLPCADISLPNIDFKYFQQMKQPDVNKRYYQNLTRVV